MSDTIKKIIRLDMDIESLRSSAETARKLMENMENSGKPPQKLISSFEKVDKILSKIEARTKDGIFRGTDAEYHALQSELNSVGEEFEFIQGIITKIGAMDDDALSKFLTKEDIQIFNKATKALRQYQSTLKSLKTNGSSVLVNAKEKHKNVETKLNIVKEKQSYRSGVVEEKKQTLTDKGYFAGKEAVSQANTNLKIKQSELTAAQQKEKESKTAITSIDNEIKAIEARMEEEKAALEEQLKELKNAKAAFARIQKFYETPDENGSTRDINVDYGDKSYQRAQERVRTAEAGVQSYTDLKNERQRKLQEKTAATEKLSDASKEIKTLITEVNKNNQAYQEAVKSQEELEESLKDVIREWKEAKEIYDDVTSDVEKLTRAQEDAQRAITNAEASEEVNKKTDLIAAYEKLCKEAEEMGIELDSLGISMEYSEESEEKLTQAILKRKKAMVDGIRVTEGSEEAFEKMDDALVDNRQNLEKSRKAQEEYNEELKQSEIFEAKIKQFLGMAGAIELFRNALRSAFETTKELDSIMTEMAVVTDLEIGDYWKQLPEHTQRAKELGTSIKSVYEAETLYYQQGLKTNEVVALSNQTLKMARIAGLSAADATDKMTAALRGFNMELNEESAQRVADVYSELAAITAADVNDISSAMSKTASIASSAGMEFETTAAFLSQIIETTQESAETAGTAMKTVIARFQELKKSPSEIGEIDGEIVDANAIEKALRSVGVSLRDANGQFRELDDVFLELSSKWRGLDKNTQRYIATIAAGSRQQSRFLAMMSDYGRTQELVAAANDSSGASQEQFEKTMESLTAKLEQLKASWDEFTTSILDSDLVKFGVEALTKFLEIINKATEGFGGFGSTVMKVLTTILMFKLGQKLFENIKNPIKKFFTEFVKDIYDEGLKSGEAYRKGVEDSKKQNEQKKSTTNTSTVTTPKTDEANQEGTEDTEVGEETTGPAAPGEEQKQNYFQRQNATREKNKAARQEARKNKQTLKSKKPEMDQKRQQAADKKSKGWDKSGKELGGEEAAKARKEYETLNTEVQKYDQEVQKANQASKEAWADTGKQISEVGGGIAAVGVGISVVGGLLSSLGLEEAGKVITFVGTAISLVGGALMVIPPILTLITAHPIIAIITAIAAVVIGLITAIVSFVQNNSLDAKLANAKKNLEDAKAAAEAAKGELDEMMSAKDEYDDLQKQLKDLVKGTNEWKEALRASNEQVLKLLETYPKLAQYITKGESGELQISDAGWDQMIANQEKAVNNTQGLVMQAQLEVKDFEMTMTKEDYTNASKVYSYDSEGNRYLDQTKTSGLREELEQIYLVGENSLDAMEGKAEELAKKYGTTTEAVKHAARELEEASSSINDISEQSESIARSYLTTMASEQVTESKFGNAAIDAFANSVNSEVAQAAVNEQVAKLKEESDYQDSEEFDRLAKEYGVENQMTGSDTHDLQTLYAAVAGLESIEDIPEGIAEDREKMLEEIAKADINNKLLKGMEEYTIKLTELAEQDSAQAQNIAGMLSDEGKGMTREFADSFMKDSDEDGQRDDFDRAKVDEYANKYFGGIENWAKAVGKTTEELYDEMEKNVRSSITINQSAFSKLNQFLKTGIDSFGKNAQISTKNIVYLSEKIVGATAIAGEEGGLALKESLDSLLASAGEEADTLANVLGTLNWNSVEEWEQLPELLNNLGISVNEAALDKLISQVDNLSIAVEKVDFEAFTQKIQNLYDTMKAMASGEQGRIFNKDTYKLLVDSNEGLAEQFVQIGDEFHYLGDSMEELTSSLRVAALYEAKKTQVKLESQKDISDSVVNFEKEGAIVRGEDYKLSDGGHEEWDRVAKIGYLEQYVDDAKQQGISNLSYVTDELGNSLGMSLGTNFSSLTDDKLDEMLGGLNRLQNDNDKLKTEVTKAVSDGTIAGYTLMTTESNIANAQALRGNKDTETQADEYSKAISIQASESGMVAESVISEYNQLIEADSTDPEVTQRMEDLEKIMQDGIKKNQDALAKIGKINDLTNQIMEAQIAIRQHEIDKLSEINESVKTAGDNMVGKIQDQINADRAARELEDSKKSLASKQSQLMYLMGSSGGSSQLAALGLQQQIQDEQQNLQDSLIDQGLQNLTDANAAAAEQRERQIEMMQATLDNDIENGTMAREAEKAVLSSLAQINEGIDPLKTEMYNILSQAEQISGGMVTANQQEIFNGEFITKATDTADSLNSINSEGATADGQTEVKKVASAIEVWLKKEEARAQQESVRMEAENAAQQNKIAQVQTGAKAISSGDTAGYEAAKLDYVAAGGNSADFNSMVKNEMATNSETYKYSNDKGEVTAGVIGGLSSDGFIAWEGKNSGWKKGTIEYDGTEYDICFSFGQQWAKTGDTAKALDERFGAVEGGTIVMYDDNLFARWGETWQGVVLSSDKQKKRAENAKNLRDKFKTKINAYKEGGLADFTGPAWLDGTKAHPELVLNARDTQNFIQLKDILAEILDGTNHTTNNSQNKQNTVNTIDIDINVESIGDDYDVEQLADKIRSMLYEDASYRNVNSVSLKR